MDLFNLPELQETTLGVDIRPVRVYPCRECSRNVSIVSTGDPERPTRAICDPCQLPTNECNCERGTIQ